MLIVTCFLPAEANHESNDCDCNASEAGQKSGVHEELELLLLAEGILGGVNPPAFPMCGVVGQLFGRRWLNDFMGGGGAIGSYGGGGCSCLGNLAPAVRFWLRFGLRILSLGSCGGFLRNLCFRTLLLARILRMRLNL